MKPATLFKKTLLLAALGVGAAAVGVFFPRWYDHRASNFNGTRSLYVTPGMDGGQALDTLLASGCVRWASSLRRTLPRETPIRPGHYKVGPGLSSMYVARMLRAGWQTPVTLTLSGSIRTPGILARKIGAQMLVDSAEVAQFALCDDSLARYGIRAAALFTRIIPDSYQMVWTASVRDIFDRLVRERDAWWTPERRALARRQGLTVEEASTLASIVSGETHHVPEQPAIAAVYLNRLHKRMKLQADPTVAFCFDYEPRRILRAHLRVNSPYNTYMHFGLPPGPIACPPKSCLEAVLHPDAHQYLYFCADPSFNGTHRFATSYAEHQANARAFQRALTLRMREEGK